MRSPGMWAGLVLWLALCLVVALRVTRSEGFVVGAGVFLVVDVTGAAVILAIARRRAGSAARGRRAP